MYPKKKEKMSKIDVPKENSQKYVFLVYLKLALGNGVPLYMVMVKYLFTWEVILQTSKENIGLLIFYIVLSSP